MMYDLSVIIPARNEMFLKKTVDNVLENIRGNTQIIVISDGDWPIDPIDDDERVVLIKTGEPVGQRAATNLGAKISEAKYIMKLDAHCAVDEGFDVKLMKDCESDWIVIPRMYNLHAFDWKCKKCGSRWYQGPTPNKCMKMEGHNVVENTACEETENFERKIIWKPRKSRRSDFMRFDENLHFQYWSGFQNRPEAKGDIAPTMSCLGACWFLERDYYWKLDGLDEKHGSWGQMGTELACKTWLSGGKMMVNKKTWFSHMFRTQGGDFGFPYPLSSKAVSRAREHSKKLWKENKWSGAKHSLDWLIEKFAPVPGWHDNSSEQAQKKLTKGVVYYTDSRLDEAIASKCRIQILKGIKEKHIVSVSLKPLNFGTNVTLHLEPGYLTMARQILVGLEASSADVIFFCEHDVLYDPSYFDFIPEKKDVYYYNTNIWQVRKEDGHALYTENCRKLSQLCAYRDTLINHYRKRVRLLEQFLDQNINDSDFNRYVRKMGFEPGTHNRKERVDDIGCEDRRSTVPSIDIRHSKTLTPNRWNKDQYRNKKYTHGWTESSEIPGWGQFTTFFDKLPE